MIEVGAGTGLFSVEMAERHPDLQFAALDVKADRLQAGAYEAAARGLTNLRFIRARADQINELFDSHSALRIWITFPDPFPKRRSEGRRLTHPFYLAKYEQLLGLGGAIHLKHDNPEFFCWSLEQCVAANWRLTELVFDLHESTADPHSDARILTTYESRWLKDGRTIGYMAASPKAK